MAYHITLLQEITIKNLLRKGYSIRDVCKKTGAAKHTVNSRRKLLMSKYEIPDCKCGDVAGHIGWCSYRFKKSKKRQEFMRSWSKGRATVS